MRIVAISDIHEFQRQITVPDGDVLISAGDETLINSLDALQDYCNWMRDLPHPNKILIFGNHSLKTEHGQSKRDPSIKMVKDAGIHYLEDSGVEIGGLKFWGSPVQPIFYSWAWNRKRGSDIAKHWAMIPDDCNVLITHGPPYGIRDEVPRGVFGSSNEGCEDLLARIKQLKQLKLHVFGHIHYSHGMVEQDGVVFVNAAICSEKPYQPTNKPTVIDLP